MTSGNSSRDGSGGAVSSTSLLGLPSASPWRRSPWGHGSGLRAAGSVLGQGCACPASHPPWPLRAQAPCQRVWLGGDLPAARPPPGPASLQSPAGEGLPLRGEEGRLQKTGPAGGQLSSPGVRGGVSGPGKGAQRLRDLEGHVAGRGGWAGPQSPRRSWAARSDAELEPGTLSRPLRQPLSGDPVPRGQKGPHCPGASPGPGGARQAEQVAC